LSLPGFVTRARPVGQAGQGQALPLQWISLVESKLPKTFLGGQNCSGSYTGGSNQNARHVRYGVTRTSPKRSL